MKFGQKISKWFLDEYLSNTSNYYVKAKIRLTFNISIILLIFLTALAIFLSFVQLTTIAMFIGILVLVLFAIPLILKYKQDIKLASKLFVLLAVLNVSVSFIPSLQIIGLHTELWMVVLILYTFYTLGKKWGIVVTAMAIIELIFYSKYLLYDNLHDEAVYAPDKLISLAITFFMALGIISYMVTQFMQAQEYAENRYRESYRKLEEQNKIIEKQRDEKTSMLIEIHHRMKNNLQIVNSLLKFQSYEVEDKRALELFEECQNRVISMALLHEKMYKSEDLAHIDVKEYIELLATDLINTYKVDKNITLDVQVEALDIGMKTLVPLGLIINEIISNSMKYAFTKKKEGEIFIDIRKRKGKKYQLIIGDNGEGPPEAWTIEESETLGMELIRTFTEQLNGEIKKLDEPGTVFSIDFEKQDKI
ncbi:MAG: hypothetical protein JKY09_05630 [Crocinitomicaceae bacterium]|nr:hypothetical protein [Crocinitomicaceae bacterium]